MRCETMNGKSNVFHYLREHKSERMLIIADGAAFGSEIDRVLRLIEGYENVALYLPESFEWLILSAGILKNNHVTEILDAPYDYVDSEEFFSWERFFTSVLIDETKDTYLAYMKKKLNPAYLQDVIKETILSSQNTVDKQSKVRYYICRNQFNFILFIILECLNDGSHIFHNGGNTKVSPKC